MQPTRLAAASFDGNEPSPSASSLNAQVVSLGAGFDTCFWQLSAAGAAPRLFVEIDQESIVQRKSAILVTWSTSLSMYVGSTHKYVWREMRLAQLASRATLLRTVDVGRIEAGRVRTLRAMNISGALLEFDLGDAVGAQSSASPALPRSSSSGLLPMATAPGRGRKRPLSGDAPT